MGNFRKLPGTTNLRFKNSHSSFSALLWDVRHACMKTHNIALVCTGMGRWSRRPAAQPPGYLLVELVSRSWQDSSMPCRWNNLDVSFTYW